MLTIKHTLSLRLCPAAVLTTCLVLENSQRDGGEEENPHASMASMRCNDEFQPTDVRHSGAF